MSSLDISAHMEGHIQKICKVVFMATSVHLNIIHKYMY